MTSQPMTFQEIADKLGCDKKTAFNICPRALKKIAADREAVDGLMAAVAERHKPTVSVRNAVKAARRVVA